jgi:hypothetical protein
VSAASISYEPLPSAWTALSADIDAGQRFAAQRDAAQWKEDLYGTLRTFGLEGGLTIRSEDQELRWGGFLLDLACLLADWMKDERPRRTTLRPIEQSNNVEIDARVEPATITSGPFVLHVPVGELRLAVEGFLRDLSLDAAVREPRLAGVPGFEWVADRGSTVPRESGEDRA